MFSFQKNFRPTGKFKEYGEKPSNTHLDLSVVPLLTFHHICSLSHVHVDLCWAFASCRHDALSALDAPAHIAQEWDTVLHDHNIIITPNKINDYSVLSNMPYHLLRWSPLYSLESLARVPLGSPVPLYFSRYWFQPSRLTIFYA